MFQAIEPVEIFHQFVFLLVRQFENIARGVGIGGRTMLSERGHATAIRVKRYVHPLNRQILKCDRFVNGFLPKDYSSSMPPVFNCLRDRSGGLGDAGFLLQHFDFPFQPVVFLHLGPEKMDGKPRLFFDPLRGEQIGISDFGCASGKIASLYASLPTPSPRAYR